MEGLETPSFRKLFISSEVFPNASAFPGAAVTPKLGCSFPCFDELRCSSPRPCVPGDSRPSIIYCDSVPAPVPWPVSSHPSPCHRRRGDFTAGSFNHYGAAAPSSLPCDGLGTAGRVPSQLEGRGM